MCWSRSPRSNPRLLFPHRRQRSPASPKFTSFATRHRRRRPDPTRTASPHPRNMVRPPLHQHPRRPAAHMVHPLTKHYISRPVPLPVVTRWQPNFMVLCLSFFLFHANSTKKRKKNDLTSDKVYEQPDYHH